MKRRLALWLGGAVSAAAGFAFLTHELREDGVLPGDEWLLLELAEFRSPRLTRVALEITALGSPTLLTLFSLIVVVVCLRRRMRAPALQMALSSIGSLCFTIALKHWIDRERPSEAARLVDVSGFSYPSGHSLAAAAFYLTLAILIGANVRDRRTAVLVALVTVLVALLVALSRLYLGVHHPSDALAGIALGSAWALFLAGYFSFERHRSKV